MSAPFANIAAHLPEMARLQPHTPAVFFPAGRDRSGRARYTHFTYSQLEAESNRIACALEAYGIGRGVRTALMVPPGLEFFALTFALFKVGAVPILIDPGMGVKNLKACIQEAAPEAFIGIPKAHVARLLFGWGKGSLTRLLTVGKKFGWGGKTLQEISASVPPGSPYLLAAPASPRGPSTPTATSPLRSRRCAASTTSARARSTSRPFPSSRSSLPPWG
jgi:non-ribosomal peptide synthetase component F